MSENRDILIITDSYDTTTDLVLKKIGGRCFRLNSDIFRDYRVCFGGSGFRVESPAELVCSSREISSVYWRKPFGDLKYHDVNCREYFFYSEARYILNEMYNLCVREGAYALVEKGAERRLGKLEQLAIANQYFIVPAWNVTSNFITAVRASIVAKSLSGEPIDAENVLYTADVSGRQLALEDIWFTQDRIEKKSDVTVCFVDGLQFAFELERKSDEIDWRVLIGRPESQSWLPINLSSTLINAISEFMAACDLRFGRIDFVRAVDGGLIFLEVNPNGQWAWLDPDDQVGLITCICDTVSRSLVREK